MGVASSAVAAAIDDNRGDDSIRLALAPHREMTVNHVLRNIGAGRFRSFILLLEDLDMISGTGRRSGIWRGHGPWSDQPAPS